MKKKRQRLAVLFSLLLAAILVLTGCAGSGKALDETTQQKSDQHEVVQQKNSEQETDDQWLTSQDTNRLEVHFIDVGQADAILIRCGDQSMLVDAGTNDSSSSLTAYLESCGVTDLTYVIGTHPHEDHIGGLDEVIDRFLPGAVIMPDKEHTTAAFEDVLTAIEENGVDLYRPQLYDEYQLGEATFTIIAPVRDYGDNLNNWSVGILLSFGENRFIMYGDGEIEAEYDICELGIDLSADVLKVSHHGSSTATSEAIIKAVQPEFAVISCGKENVYGHPHAETMSRLEALAVKTYRTDFQGTIVAVSDGQSISFYTNMGGDTAEAQEHDGAVKRELAEESQLIENSVPIEESRLTENSEPIKKIDSIEESDTNQSAVKDETSHEQNFTIYVTNSGTKYHIIGCHYLSSSSSAITLEAAKEAGYTPCSVCKPPE